jgi:hypothetical protein
MKCPLCYSKRTHFFTKDRLRNYHQCTSCDLVFVPENFFLSPNEEKSRYDFHENSPEDPNYLKFLSQLTIPLKNYLKENWEGLDYGCGPGPAMPTLFKDSSQKIFLYDTFYEKNEKILQKKYDFLISTEVIEHFHYPHEEFEKLKKLLKTHTVIGFMTELLPEKNFDKWYYKNDDTHVMFYSKKTMQFLANFFEKKIEIVGNRVIILH